MALDGLDIAVPRGSVYALLGRNGSGKSTLIQLVMGMLEPTAGSVEVLGLDPIRDDIAMKKRVGYIPDRLPMYDWMTVGEHLGFVASMYDNWSLDEQYSLMQRFRIKPEQKVGALSRGYRALLSLVFAMSHSPDLVLLDECTSGMDAIARQEFERSVIDALQDSGRTVLFAGHQIGEMERICDWVGIISQGKLVMQMPLDELKESVKTLIVRTDEQAVPIIPGCRVLRESRFGNELRIAVQMVEPGGQLAVPDDVKVLSIESMNLEEIFVALAGSEDPQ